jgi:hypothetical protein
MLTKRVFAKSRFLTITLVMMMAAGPLLQTTLAQKRSLRDDVERAPVAQDDQPPPEAPADPVSNQQRRTRPVSATVVKPSTPNVCTPVTATHSTSQAITPGNSFGLMAMGIPPGQFVQTSYWRYFNVASFSGGALDVQSVDIGIEAETGASKLVTVNLYTSVVPFPTLYPNALILLGTAQQVIGNQTGTIVNIPVTGTAPAGSQLVVEINVPDWVDTGRLLIGSNAAPENAPSYLSSAQPQLPTLLPNPTTTAALSQPNMHIVMNVHGCGSPAGVATGSAASSPWTAAGADGTIDEDSLAIAQLSNFALGLMPGATGTVTARYNITGVAGLSRFCPATQSSVSLRFRDSDSTGPTAQVVLEIHRTNPDLGGNEIIYAFDSNSSSQPAGSAFQSFSSTPAIDFDFGTYIYWIEAKITKTDPSSYAHFGSIRISETAGTACP